MGTRIDAVTTTMGHLRRANSARKLADRAGQECIAKAGLRPADIDLLINAGLYHDHNLGEPALAALIQEDIGVNTEDPQLDGHGTFSFDVANGACGMLTALRVADGFLRAGTIRRALIIASDAHPGRGLASRFPYVPAAGALVCSYDTEVRGIVALRFGNDVDADVFRSSVGFQRGRNVLTFDERMDFLPRAAMLAGKVASEMLADAQLGPSDVDLVVANPLDRVFLDGLATNLGVDPQRLILANHAAGVHTAGLAFALDEAARTGRLDDAATVLLVSGAAGVTAGTALLLNPKGNRR